MQIRSLARHTAHGSAFWRHAHAAAPCGIAGRGWATCRLCPGGRRAENRRPAARLAGCPCARTAAPGGGPGVVCVCVGGAALADGATAGREGRPRGRNGRRSCGTGGGIRSAPWRRRASASSCRTSADLAPQTRPTTSARMARGRSRPTLRPCWTTCTSPRRWSLATTGAHVRANGAAWGTRADENTALFGCHGAWPGQGRLGGMAHVPVSPHARGRGRRCVHTVHAAVAKVPVP